MNRIITTIALLVIIVTMSACGKSNIVVDYADAASFESALNSGENLEGKVVTFVALELEPQSEYGYDIYSGEHLNFVSNRHPDVKAGDVVTVKATEISSILGSWIIEYEMINVEKAEDTEIQHSSDTTDEATNSGNNLTSVESETAIESTETIAEATIDKSENQTFVSVTTETEEEKKGVEIVDAGWSGDIYNDGQSIYIDFCGLVNNPNETYVVEYPELTVTVKKSTGEIITTESQTVSKILPGDTVPISGTIFLSMEEIKDDAHISFDIKCWKTYMYRAENINSPRTTDFEIVNVFEHSSGNKTKVTGEIKNNFIGDIYTVKLTLLLRKDGEIVYVKDSFVDNLLSGETTPFEITLGRVPEYDDIEIIAYGW